MELYQFFLFLIIFIAFILAIYIGSGGRSRWNILENPEKIIGKTIRFLEIECSPNGLLPKSIKMPIATVVEFTDLKYYLKFSEPFELNGRLESSAYIQARHKGYPISSVGRLAGLTVGGTFESGESFIAEIRLSH